MDKSTQNNITSSKTKLIYLIAGVAAFQIVRILAYQITKDVAGGSVAQAWLFPAYMDMFIGITAPFIAYGLIRKTGLGIWTSAIVWFALSISDHLDAITVLAKGSGPAPSMMSNASASIIQLIVMSLLEFGMILLLTSSKLRKNYNV